MSNYLGIDIGGTNVCYGIVDDTGETIFQNSRKTESIESIQSLVEMIHKDIKKAKISIEGIGIGAPSVNEFTQQIEYAPNLNWGEIIPIAEVFSNQFNLPTVAINDANAAAIGEREYGEAADMQNFAVITLGTGIGMGAFINGSLLVGHHGLAGEIGHSIVRRDGRECKCGNFGCLETYIAKSGIIKTAKEKLEFSSGGSILQLISPSDLDPEEIFKAARKEDPVALEVLDAVSRDLAFAISNLINILDLECVFLSGGITINGNLLKRKTEKYLKSYVLPNLHDKTFLKISTLNEKNGGILGAVASIYNKLNATALKEIE